MNTRIIMSKNYASLAFAAIEVCNGSYAQYLAGESEVFNEFNPRLEFHVNPLMEYWAEAKPDEIAIMRTEKYQKMALEMCIKKEPIPHPKYFNTKRK